MNYAEFFRFLKKWRGLKRYPTSQMWPREITLDSKAWEGIQKLYNLTRMDGHEYETAFFFVEGDTYLTTPMRGTRDQVTASHSLQVKYEIDQKRRVYYRNILIDGKVINKVLVKPDKLTGDLQIGYLFNIHSHPEHVNAAKQVTYSFFSDTDIRTLLASDAVVSGLVTDKFWLVVKTDQAISKVGEVGEDLLRQISEKAFAGESYLDEVIQQNMSRWGLVFYRADFKRGLIRVN